MRSNTRSTSLSKVNCLGTSRERSGGGRYPSKGRFEQVQGGTLFLDHIEDLSLSIQAKLERFLQDKMQTIAVDVRIVAATHRDLELAAPRRALFARIFSSSSALRLFGCRHFGTVRRIFRLWLNTFWIGTRNWGFPSPRRAWMQ